MLALEVDAAPLAQPSSIGLERNICRDSLKTNHSAALDLKTIVDELVRLRLGDDLKASVKNQSHRHLRNALLLEKRIELEAKLGRTKTTKRS